MTLAPTSSPTADLPAALHLPWDLRLTPEQFEQVCQVNPDAVLELAADGQLIAMTPTGGETSARTSALLVQLALAIGRTSLALKIFDSSGGFRLHDRSVLSPDAALVRLERWQASHPSSGAAFRPSAPIWWWSWPAHRMRARGA